MHSDFQEQRRTPRAKLSQLVRIRPFHPALPSEYCSVFNVSQVGLHFATPAGYYIPGMKVYVGDYESEGPLNRVAGTVVRVEKLEGEKWGVAVRLF